MHKNRRRKKEDYFNWKKKTFCIIFLVSAVLTIISGFFVAGDLVKDYREKKYWEEIRAARNAAADPTKPPTGENILPEFQNLYEKNPDLIGWLTINGINISWPVMQTKEDPEYYLWRDFDGCDEYLGPPFIDYRCNVLSTRSFNLILYGHYAIEDRMLGGLLYYAFEPWGLANDICFDTLEEKGTYKVIAAFACDVSDARLIEPGSSETEEAYTFYNYIELDSKEGFEKFCENLQAQSQYKSEISITPEDELLTVICCAPKDSYPDLEDGRFVVVAKKVPEKSP